jgi:hypothetical protein
VLALGLGLRGIISAWSWPSMLYCSRLICIEAGLALARYIMLGLSWLWRNDQCYILGWLGLNIILDKGYWLSFHGILSAETGPGLVAYT